MLVDVTRVTLDELVRATPPERDRYVDFLRGASIVAVMLGHWLIGLVAWNGGVIRSASAIGRTSGLWLGTWILQVMPVFFFVGGYSNYVAFRSSQQRGETTVSFVGRRIQRLLLPFVPFLLVWTAVQIGLHLSDTGSPTGPRLGNLALLRGVRPPGQTIPFGPLWFLAVYLAVVALSPLTIRLHHRFRWWVPAVMVAGTVVADGFGFLGGQSRVRYLNVAFVLLFPHQLGHFYGDGTTSRWSKRVPAAMMAVGLGSLILLTNPWVFSPFGADRWRWFPGIGHYPRSLLGTDVEKISNAYPPTLCFLAACIWMVGLAVMLRAPLTRWLQRRGPWKATVAVNSRIMTMFLWHMTAFLLAVVALWPVGLGHQATPSLRWWAERPLWIAVPAVILAVIVALVGPFETRGHAPRPGRGPAPVQPGTLRPGGETGRPPARTGPQRASFRPLWVDDGSEPSRGTATDLDEDAQDDCGSEGGEEPGPGTILERSATEPADEKGVAGPHGGSHGCGRHEPGTGIRDDAASESDRGAATGDEPANQDQPGSVVVEGVPGPSATSGASGAGEQATLDGGAEMPPQEVGEVVAEECTEGASRDQDGDADVGVAGGRDA